jgi:hypothetical protein
MLLATHNPPMGETETRKTVGVDGLIEFGQYLNTLTQPAYKDYSFNMPDGEGRLKRCSLDDVIRCYQEFFDGKVDIFRVWIGYNDYLSNTMASREMSFTRNKQTE